jgi:hypothetical protein
MTLEEIRILAACPGLNKPGCESCDAHTTSDDDRCWGCAVEMEAPTLAALLVRAVEALAETMTAEPQTRLCYSKTCPGREFPCSVVDDSRSLLRELGVEA